MARRKSNAEVGPFGVWAYDTRIALDLSVEGVIAALPTHYHPATLRKIEGGSSAPGTRMWRELRDLYTRLATEGQVAIDPQPRLPGDEPPTASPDLAQALVDLTEEIGALRRERMARGAGSPQRLRLRQADT